MRVEFMSVCVSVCVCMYIVCTLYAGAHPVTLVAFWQKKGGKKEKRKKKKEKKNPNVPNYIRLGRSGVSNHFARRQTTNICALIVRV